VDTKSEHPGEDLRIIRDLMYRATKDRVLAGWEGISWGVVFLVAGTVTHVSCVTGETFFLAPAIVCTWIGLVSLGILSELLSYAWKTSRAGILLFPPLVRQLILAYLAMTLLGIAFGTVFVHLGEYMYLPGGMILVFGTTIVIHGLLSMSPKALLIRGGLYVATGLLAMGPFLEWSFLVVAFVGGTGSLFWGIWILRLQGEFRD